MSDFRIAVFVKKYIALAVSFVANDLKCAVFGLIDVVFTLFAGQNEGVVSLAPADFLFAAAGDQHVVAFATRQRLFFAAAGGFNRIVSCIAGC